jgi:hypothetical protein
MVRVGLHEESLELVYWWPRLALNSMLDDHDALLSPLLAALGILLGALDGDVR